MIPNSSEYFPDNPAYIKRIMRRDIKVIEAQENATEAFIFGGEECVPILYWDDHKIGEKGEIGPAAILFQDYLRSFSKTL